MSKSDRVDSPILITDAAPSFDDQQSARRRKYFIIMGARIPCLILAGVFINTWWLALALVALSVPLPWVAVLIANDRPPRKAEEVSRFKAERAARRALERENHAVIDG